jgi:6-phosphofructokinase 1
MDISLISPPSPYLNKCRYIDPSYMIRSVPANANDTLYCMQLGQNAVHGTMAGYTGFSVGLCNNKMCLLPIPQLVATSPRQMDPKGRTWERILAVTRQPNSRTFSRGSLLVNRNP